LPKIVQLPFDPSGTFTHPLLYFFQLGPHRRFYNDRPIRMDRYFQRLSLDIEHIEANAFFAMNDPAAE
jgi:hypothetical protein